MMKLRDLLDRILLPRAITAPEMSLGDLSVIERFAAGDQSLREEAVRIHRAGIPVVGVRGNDHQRFMAEVDTPSPDLALRHAYRERILANGA